LNFIKLKSQFVEGNLSFRMVYRLLRLAIASLSYGHKNGPQCHSSGNSCLISHLQIKNAVQIQMALAVVMGPEGTEREVASMNSAIWRTMRMVAIHVGIRSHRPYFDVKTQIPLFPPSNSKGAGPDHFKLKWGNEYL
jgi:hypothetical protein